ncbi:MAG: nitroreductase family protein [Candidatus Aminicenantaceae bacterium]
MRSESSDFPRIDPWYAAIFVRRSRRSYLTETISAEALECLGSVCREFRPFSEARAVLIQAQGESVFKGIVGSYGKIDNNPWYIAFIGNMASARVQEAVGYTGEGIILEATSLGLGTCWVGGYFRPEAVAQRMSLGIHERVLAVTPVGIASDGFTFKEKLMSGFGRMHRRKPLQQLVTGIPEEDWMTTALEAARVAPSAVNRQPWRFEISGRSICIALDESRDTFHVARRLDCGIAMLHLELGAGHAGASVQWSFPAGSVACLSAS